MAKLISLMFLFFCYALASDSGPTIEYKINWVNFTFPNSTVYDNYMNTLAYESCLPSGIRLDSKKTIYISIPRLKPNVYSTLNTLVDSTNNVALLKPFPSYEGNEIGNTDSLQSVLGFEIDLDDNIWVLDQGKVDGVRLTGSAKLRKYSNSGDILETYPLDPYINPQTSFLNDLVLDIKGHHVYISDSGVPNSAIIVINTETKATTRLLQNDESVNPDPSLWIYVNGSRVYSAAPTQVGVDGIALSCSKEVFYYTPLTSRTLYAIKTEYLKNPPANISKEVIKLGYKYTASGGLISSQNGRLYLSGLESNTLLLQSDIKPNAENFQFNILKPIIESNKFVWADTLAFYNEDKKLYVMANQLHNFFSGNIDFKNPLNGDANFYIWSIYVNDKSYLETCLDDDVESNDNSFPAWAIALVVIVVLVVIVIVVCAIRKYYQAKKKRQTFL